MERRWSLAPAVDRDTVREMETVGQGGLGIFLLFVFRGENSMCVGLL